MRLFIPGLESGPKVVTREIVASRWTEKYDEPFDPRWIVTGAVPLSDGMMVELKLSADDGTPDLRSLRRPLTTVSAQPSSARNVDEADRTKSETNPHGLGALPDAEEHELRRERLAEAATTARAAVAVMDEKRPEMLVATPNVFKPYWWEEDDGPR